MPDLRALGANGVGILQNHQRSRHAPVDIHRNRLLKPLSIVLAPKNGRVDTLLDGFVQGAARECSEHTGRTRFGNQLSLDVIDSKAQRLTL